MFSWPKLTEHCTIAFAVYDTPVDEREAEIADENSLREVTLRLDWGGWPPPQGILGPQTDTQVFHFEKEGRSVFAFRGTEFSKALKSFDGQKFKDVLTDIAVLNPQRYDGVDGGLVHQGFARAVAEVWPWLSLEIQRVRDSEISFAGHSLGGALATTAALRAVDQLGANLHTVFTYGSPRVFNTILARHYNQKLGTRTIRCVDDKDFVSRVPIRFPIELPAWLGGFNWSHVGQPVLLNQSTAPSCDWGTFLQQSFEEVIHGWRSGTILESGADHLAYVDDIGWNREQYAWPQLVLPDPPC